MMFIYSDSLDFVDPHYDFLRDESPEGRRPYWDDAFPHEILHEAPYDGILVSRSIVGDHRLKGKYSDSQAMRFRRVGARRFLRFDGPEHKAKPLFGDCGAFSYSKLDEPPYGAADTVEYYGDAGFTHGCSVDHVIFEFEPDPLGMSGGSANARHRFEITLENAAEFKRESRALGPSFTPLGVIQGWSPNSMAEAARRLESMGYDYLAVGGLVPLDVEAIARAVTAIRSALRARTRLHLLGVAKADDIARIASLGIASTDTTSPLLRAFKDTRSNYYALQEDGSITYYTAIRVPQALENLRLTRLVKSGRLGQEELVLLEAAALDALRAYDEDALSLEETFAPVMAYATKLFEGDSETARRKQLVFYGDAYRRMLADKPWKRCGCRICRECGIEVAIFRSTNRNKRRGIHNLWVFNRRLKRLTGELALGAETDIHCDRCAAE